ncbi:substrate-binding domain-containing protein [Sodalis sp. RH22]|uniref:substrate-binding domain-containing protein n=1 Tax=unclassified Sodalis (in: enterobacteria) TaxID=2636512 RepID=UPI0039B54916
MESASVIKNNIILIMETDKLQERACSEVMNYLTRKPIPTAIIAANDFIGEGVVSAIYKCGLSLPDDLSFLMFDDPKWASFFPTPLTVIKQPAYQMGLTAASMLIDKIVKKNRTEKIIKRLSADLIVRQSVINIVTFTQIFICRGYEKGSIHDTSFIKTA